MKNQLNANSVTGAERAELELQIQIAEGELAAYREGLPLSNENGTRHKEHQQSCGDFQR